MPAIRLISILIHSLLLCGLASSAYHESKGFTLTLAIILGLWNLITLYTAAGWKEMYFFERDEKDRYLELFGEDDATDTDGEKDETD